jgi:hypothetical protein
MDIQAYQELASSDPGRALPATKPAPAELAAHIGYRKRGGENQSLIS